MGSEGGDNRVFVTGRGASRHTVVQLLCLQDWLLSDLRLKLRQMCLGSLQAHHCLSTRLVHRCRAATHRQWCGTSLTLHTVGRHPAGWLTVPGQQQGLSVAASSAVHFACSIARSMSNQARNLACSSVCD